MEKFDKKQTLKTMMNELYNLIAQRDSVLKEFQAFFEQIFEKEYLVFHDYTLFCSKQEKLQNLFLKIDKKITYLEGAFFWEQSNKEDQYLSEQLQLLDQKLIEQENTLQNLSSLFLSMGSESRNLKESIEE